VLQQVAEDVLVHQSEWVDFNAAVVRGTSGVLLIDPGIHESEMTCLANDLSELGQSVEVGFSTHPHWDHLLWHSSFGAAPRHGTARCATSARARLAEGVDAHKFGIPDEVSLDLLGLVSGLPQGSPHIPWGGPRVRILEHQGHAPGHAALFVEERGVLIAGDMLSDVLIPLLDFNDTVDPIEDYLAALRLFDEVANSVEAVIPGHGSVGRGDEVHSRIDRDRAYVQSLSVLRPINDSRIGPTAKQGYEGMADVHAQQRQRFAERSERDGTSN
jgi:glyoxylase-like metal-dependent hydrolase (beta-lactamase superfamily II)